MRYIADLHIHSKYSRACSKDLDLEHNRLWAMKKGIQILGTGDFTHPTWLAELKEKLVEEKPGLYKLKTPFVSPLIGGKNKEDEVLFMLTTELSCIYKQGDKTRRIHICVFVPDFATVDTIVADLEKRGVNLKSDGRPIMGIPADELTKVVISANKDSMVIPAHAWTPWFSVFGSKSGFDTLEECFKDQSKEIFAIETGLSSDPPMNHRLSMLDNITLISNSDAHSPANLGREANAFEIPESELSFNEIRRILKIRDKKRFLYTIEFFPEEGKYHHDGHRECQVNFAPVETKKHHGLCPVCKKPLVIGVLNRVDELADRTRYDEKNFIPHKHIVPLPEIIAESYGYGKASKKVQQAYEEFIAKGGSEFEILLDKPYEELARFTIPEVVQGIQNVREGRVRPVAGYDGVYGVIKALKDGASLKDKQKTLL